MAPSKFHDLNVYKLAAALADDCYVAVRRWPAFARQSMDDQLVRAVDSVGANIAESTGRWHPADKRRVLYIARGSLSETEYWLQRAEHRGLLAPGTQRERKRSRGL